MRNDPSMAGAGVLRFDAVRIATDDVARATRAYATLLGAEPEYRTDGTPRFALVRGAVELVAGEPGAQALRFAVLRDDGDAAAALAAARDARWNGLRVATDVRVGLADHEATDARRASSSDASPPAGDPSHGAALPADAPPGVLAIDHVVIHTPEPERALRLWRDALGIRLALDREFPARGLRMLFFRTAGVTLELVSALGTPTSERGAAAGDDVLNGVAYRVAGIDAWRERLLAAGLDVSEVRGGNKPGTRVATVRSGTEGVPTLLIEAAPGAPRPR